MSVTMEDLAIFELALAYSWTLSLTISLSLRFPGAFFGRLPFPITTVLSVGVISDAIDASDDGVEERGACGNFWVGR